ncbi:uncharacterized protein BDV14DRAFT_211954 [Aspergillus stella-maris]|uniref:uncharacterized protein n=1 Tax=Aspergillus stella-maris TaxID=1810926 RepID=UPI003CCCF9A6
MHDNPSPSGDRTLTVPPHTGDNILPNLPFFEKLLRFANRRPPLIAIRDVNAGVKKSYLQLLSDALALRKALRASLSPKIQQDLDEDSEVYIALIAPGGYEYAVAFTTILAIGAAVVPITTALPPQEAKFLIERAQCAAILSSSDDAARTLANGVLDALPVRLPHLTVSAYLQPSALDPSKIFISSNQTPNINAPALVIFTSGTTGPPKGAVQRRSYITSAAEDVSSHYRLSENDTVLHCLPVHHATGIGVTFLPFLIVGATIEFRSGIFDASWIWERFRRGGITVFSGVPTIYMRLRRYFEDNISDLRESEREAYTTGARKLRILLCGTSALPDPVQKFWKGILGGRTILTRYGGTEFHTVLKASIDGSSPPNSVGKISPGVDLKLSSDGEILLKSPLMFSKYLHDPAATKNAHDEHGYYRTGDIAFREGNNYFILGRTSLDIIKSGGYKLSALDIEREILGLEYVSEVMVVGVEDEEFGQRVGAVVVLKDGNAKMTIDALRRDLRGSLAGYKMPTLLRVVRGEIPKSGTGKVQKRVLGPRYFPRDWKGDMEVHVWERQGKRKAKL